MNLFHEYALLIAVAVPILALVGLNAFLWLGGERGVLLLPSARAESPANPAVRAFDAPVAAAVDETPAPAGPPAAAAPANDPAAREAA